VAPDDNKLQAGMGGRRRRRLQVLFASRRATVDYGSKFNYTGTLVAPGDTTAKLQAYSGLINAYYEPYTWNGLTPYVAPASAWLI